MQDALALKKFLKSDNPMLLLLGKRSKRKDKLFSTAIAFSNPNMMVLRIKGRSTLESSDLKNALLKHWVLNARSSEKPLNEQLNEILNTLNKHDQKILLLIDNTHLVPISVLAALCHLCHQQENKPIRIQMILAGYPELSPKIDALYLKKYSQPSTIRLPDPIEKKPDLQTISSTSRGFVSTFWQSNSVKTIAVLGLCLTGFLWWKMQKTLSHIHSPHPISQASQTIHSQNIYKKRSTPKKVHM